MPLFSSKYIVISGVVLACVAFSILNYFGFISFPSLFYSTSGAIYVDSPEIYTRERLVNDRYDQDFWLQEQLKRLDETDSLITGEINQQVSAGISNDTSSQKNQSVADRKILDKIQAIPFDQDFRIRSAIRDAVRQLVLENMLDDRHDLKGNSVYGLKFDTTIIPSDNSHERAFVRVKLAAADPFKIDENKLDPETANLLLPHLRAYYSKDPKSKALLEPAKTTYKNWLDNFANRLNLNMTKKFKSRDFAAKCRIALENTPRDRVIKKIILETIHEVIGYSGKMDMFMPANYKDVIAIMLPRPWGEYMTLVYSHFAADEEVCEVPPDFTANERSDNIYVIEDEETYKKENEEKLRVAFETRSRDIDIPIKFAQSLNSRQLTFLFHATSENDVNEMYKNFQYYAPSYPPSDALIDFKCSDTKKCEIWIPSGLFKFIQRVQKSDIYSYAVFPKNEVAGILTNSSVNLDMTGQFQGSAWLNFGQNRQESQLESVLVGFGDGSSEMKKDCDHPDTVLTKKDTIEFGWVLSSGIRMKPMQKTELVLVSVPAWTTRLELEIKTGWLDSNAKEHTENEFSIGDVPVPPDFQPLDSLVLEGSFERKPKIYHHLMKNNIKVIACEKGKILIPGLRLWRSATVTLGAQKADRITVLPNMEGIIAEFNPVEIPYWNEDNVLKAKLQVWTSEGVDTAENDIEIQLPNNKSCAQTARHPEPNG